MKRLAQRWITTAIPSLSLGATAVGASYG